MDNPYKDIQALGALQTGMDKADALDQAFIEDVVRGHLDCARESGLTLAPGARILDFGCGVGASVQALLDLGYDAYGVDVVELWGRDFEKYWHARERPPDQVRQRLFRIDVENYRLPFDDASFDFCFSDQVLEHVFNYPVVFAEIARVMKPGTFSVHRFPGPNCPTEAHINVPVVPLCRFPWYLRLWALLGRRSLRQQGMSWRETLQSNVDMMRFCNYPSKRELMRQARAAGVHVEFRDADGIRFSRHGRAYDIYRRTKAIKGERIVLSLLKRITQRYMVLRADRAED